MNISLEISHFIGIVAVLNMAMEMVIIGLHTMNLKKDVSQIRNKIKFERKKNMRDTIELIEMSKLVNTVVGSVFFLNENTK